MKQDAQPNHYTWFETVLNVFETRANEQKTAHYL